MIMLLSSYPLTIDVYNIKEINISPAAPNMNTFIERVVGTIRREVLDHFLLFSEKQIRKILSEYINYYNHLRPHLGIDSIPEKIFLNEAVSIKTRKILGGLHHHYFRSSA